jgi:ribulose-phosphate 3-epimerase
MKLAASLICANPLNLMTDVIQLVSGVDFIHFDVMDGLFVPRYGLYPEILTSLMSKSIGSLKVDVHMMTQEPERYIDDFSKAGANYYCVHYEACQHLHRTIKKIKDAGMKPGVALNYSTPPEVLKYVLPDIDMIVLMAINPGIVGHKIIPGIYQKIEDTRRYIQRYNILIEIDGGVTFQSANLMREVGANVLVCGTGTIFRPQEGTISEQVQKLKDLLNG